MPRSQWRTIANVDDSKMSVGATRALINLNGPGHYLHWGFIQISEANALLIALMVVVFVAAVLVPFRRGRGRQR
jgi:hypothetical protein